MQNRWNCRGRRYRSALESFRFYPNPAPGYRHRDTGVLYLVGNYGYSWSSAVSGTYGMNLDFSATWLNPSSAYSRGHGFQLRCLSE